MRNRLDPALAERLAATALDAIGREYPNHLSHWLDGDDDVGAPRELHPVFYGCLDWHSAVHNHWLVARLLKLFPDGGFSARGRRLLDERITPEAVAGEYAYLAAPGREGFERPYGWAWLLALDAELAPWREQRQALAPLVELIVSRIPHWLAAMPYPVRSGEHANTAFALGLMLDWSRATGNEALGETIISSAQRLYLSDRGATPAFEPSGQDFLSPMLAEADLMARLPDAAKFADWLADFLPAIPDNGDRWLDPARVPDSVDYKLAHLAGLNLSRAWMLRAIGTALPAGDPRRPALETAHAAHVEAGLAVALREDYGASHWLPTFAVYLLSGPTSPGQ